MLELEPSEKQWQDLVPRSRAPPPSPARPAPSLACRLLSPAAPRCPLRQPRRPSWGRIGAFCCFFNLGRGMGRRGRCCRPHPLPASGRPWQRDSTLSLGTACCVVGAERTAEAAPREECSSPPHQAAAARTTLRTGRCPAMALRRPQQRPALSPSLPPSLSSPGGPVGGQGRSLLQVGRTFGCAGSPEIQVWRTRDGKGGVRVWVGQGVPVA